MFIKQLSDEAYLAFAALHGSSWMVFDLYLSDLCHKELTFSNEVKSKLYGYASVERTNPDITDILLYEPSLNMNFVPVRLNLFTGQLVLNTVKFDKVYTATTLTLNEEDRLNVENGSATVIPTYEKFGIGWRLGFKRERWEF